jgi:hypothetical protein
MAGKAEKCKKSSFLLMDTLKRQEFRKIRQTKISPSRFGQNRPKFASNWEPARNIS